MRIVVNPAGIKHVTDAPAPTAQVEAGAEGGGQAEVAETESRRSWCFVKNLNPKEKIKLKDGTEFQFPGVVFVTDDPVMAKKILEVAAAYQIVEK